MAADFVLDFALDAVFRAPGAVFRPADDAFLRAEIFRVVDVALRPAVVVFLRPSEVAFFAPVVARFRVEDVFVRAADVGFFLATDVFLPADVVDLLRADDALLRAGADWCLDVLRPPPLDDPPSLSLPSLIF